MPSVFRVRTAISGGSGAAQVSTQYFLDNGTLTAQNAAVAVRTFWNSLAPNIVDTYHFAVEPAVESIDIGTGQPTQVTGTTTSPVTGGTNTDALPWQTQALIQLRTGTYTAGREVRGRIFIPGMSEVNNTAGIPSGTMTGSFDAAVAALIGDINSELVVYSRAHTEAVQVVTGNTWTKWASLRSRRD